MFGFHIKSIRNEPLLLQIRVLLQYLLLVAIPVLGVAYGLQQLPGFIAACVALAICTNAGLMSLLTIYFVKRLKQEVYVELLAGMMVRMALAITPALVLILKKNPLCQNGVLYYLVIFYVATLWIEVMLCIPGPDGSDVSD